jgi:7-carboxy-7-deazaguanine synthase
MMISNFILDWKLPGSGESDAYVANEDFNGNFSQLGSTDAIKFTVADRNDYEIAKTRYANEVATIQANTRPQVYCGVVWGKLDTETLCTWMLEDRLPWNLNVQVHKFIWHPDQIGV